MRGGGKETGGRSQESEVGRQEAEKGDRRQGQREVRTPQRVNAWSFRAWYGMGEAVIAFESAGKPGALHALREEGCRANAKNKRRSGLDLVCGKSLTPDISLMTLKKTP